MKALLVAAAPAASAELVASLAAIHEYVVAVDGGGALCLKAGVRPDVIVGDFDSLAGSDLADLRSQGSRVQTFPAEKDQTDLELALEAARLAGADSVTLTAASTGRLDHTLAVLAAMAHAIDLSPTLVEPAMTAALLGDGGPRRLSARGVGATISLLAWGGSCSVSASGVRWPLKCDPLAADSGLGISNVITAETADIEVHSGRLFVILPEVGGAKAHVCA